MDHDSKERAPYYSGLKLGDVWGHFLYSLVIAGLGVGVAAALSRSGSDLGAGSAPYWCQVFNKEVGDAIDAMSVLLTAELGIVALAVAMVGLRPPRWDVPKEGDGLGGCDWMVRARSTVQHQEWLDLLLVVLVYLSGLITVLCGAVPFFSRRWVLCALALVVLGMHLVISSVPAMVEKSGAESVVGFWRAVRRYMLVARFVEIDSSDGWQGAQGGSVATKGSSDAWACEWFKRLLMLSRWWVFFCLFLGGAVVARWAGWAGWDVFFLNGWLASGVVFLSVQGGRYWVLRQRLFAFLYIIVALLGVVIVSSKVWDAFWRDGSPWLSWLSLVLVVFVLLALIMLALFTVPVPRRWRRELRHYFKQEIVGKIGEANRLAITCSDKQCETVIEDVLLEVDAGEREELRSVIANALGKELSGSSSDGVAKGDRVAAPVAEPVAVSSTHPGTDTHLRERPQRPRRRRDGTEPAAQPSQAPAE